MAYNRIPLALAYDGDTGIASGLVEFTLSSTDFADFCSDATPELGQALVWSGTCYGPSTIPAGGGGGGGIPVPSDVDEGDILSYNGASWLGSSTEEMGYATTASLTSYATTASLTSYATTASLTNNDYNYTTLAGIQTITGAKTFEAAPIIRTATVDTFATIGAASALSSIVSPGANSLLAYGGGNTPEAIASTDHMLTFLGTSADLSSCRDVSSSTFATGGDNAVLVWDESEEVWKGGHFDGAITMTTGTGGKALIGFNRLIAAPLGTTGKGDLTAGIVYVSGTSSTQTELVPASVFGRAFLSGSPAMSADEDRFLYLSGDGGQYVAASTLAPAAKNFLINGNTGAGQLDHGALAGLGDNDHPQYLLSATAATTYATSANLTSYSATIATKTPYVLYTSGGDPAIQVGESSTSYVDLFTFTIPAGALGSHGSVHVEWGGDVLHRAGLTGNTGVKILLNSTNVISNTSNQIAADNDPYPLKGSLVIGAKGATNKQRVTHWIEAGAAAGSVGDGGWLYGKNSGTMAGDGTEDSTAAMTVSFQVKFTVSDANHFFRLYHVRATVYPDIN